VFGVEPICRVLTEHGMPIAPSTYYEARNRGHRRGVLFATSSCVVRWRGCMR